MPMWQGPVPVVALVWSWPLCWPMVSWSLADVMAVTVVEVVAVVAFPRWRVLHEGGEHGRVGAAVGAVLSALLSQRAGDVVDDRGAGRRCRAAGESAGLRWWWPCRGRGCSLGARLRRW